MKKMEYAPTFDFQKNSSQKYFMQCGYRLEKWPQTGEVFNRTVLFFDDVARQKISEEFN
jgi:hypothetical protein